jgi:hypothetical protein
MHGDASAMLGASISVSNLALKQGESISMGEVLYATKWVKYSALPQATTQNTTTTHNNQHEPLPAYPSAALALSLQGNILHGPKSWCHCSLWVRQWRDALGALLPLFYPLFGAPKRNPLKNRERDGILALGSHFLVGRNNNQLKDGIHSRRDIGEGAPPGWNVWGRCRAIVWGGKLSNKKIKIKKYIVALNGRQSIFQMQQPIKNTRRDGGEEGKEI